jgi:hypothetical protein
MMRTLSKIISLFFHPVFVPLLGFLLLYSYSGYGIYLPESIFWFSILIIVQFTILVPVGAVYYLYWRKIISSIELSNREERPLPLIINLVSYAVNFLIFRYLNFPDIIISFFGAVVLASAFSMFVSLTYKLSLHMVAWGTLGGVILAFSLRVGIELHVLLSVTIILTALVASARMWLNQHNIQQISFAWVSSFIISFLLMIVF